MALLPRRFTLKARQLQRVELRRLGRGERKAFFLNVAQVLGRSAAEGSNRPAEKPSRHALSQARVHRAFGRGGQPAAGGMATAAFVGYVVPRGSVSSAGGGVEQDGSVYLACLASKHYDIGGLNFTFFDIKHGILRSNQVRGLCTRGKLGDHNPALQPPPNQTSAPFSQADQRAAHVIQVGLIWDRADNRVYLCVPPAPRQSDSFVPVGSSRVPPTPIIRPVSDAEPVPAWP